MYREIVRTLRSVHYNILQMSAGGLSVKWGFHALLVYNMQYLYNTVGLEINFEESDYAITEGSGLRTPIRLLFRNNQNAFTVTFTPVTIDAVEGMGLGTDFINSETIEEEARATAGKVLL